MKNHEKPRKTQKNYEKQESGSIRYIWQYPVLSGSIGRVGGDLKNKDNPSQLKAEVWAELGKKNLLPTFFQLLLGGNS